MTIGERTTTSQSIAPAGRRFGRALSALVIAGLAWVPMACGDDTSSSKGNGSSTKEDGGDKGNSAAAGTGNETASDDEGTDGISASAGDGTIWVHQGTFLEAIDTATGEDGTSVWIVNSPDDVCCTSGAVYSMVAGEGQVWLGCSNGTALAVDQDTGEKWLIEPEGADFYGLSHIGLGGGYAYVYAESLEDDGYDLVQVDTKTRAIERAWLEEAFFGVQAILVDSEAVWVVTEDDLELLKVDPSTLEVSDVVALGESAEDPKGPRTDNGGSGYFAQIGDKIWVLNDSSDILSLVSVDKKTLDVAWVDSLIDLVEPGEEYIGLMANDTSLFAYSCNESKESQVVRFDGKTGERLRSYPIESENCDSIAVSEHKIYMSSSESVYGIVQMDLETGKITASYTFGNMLQDVMVE